ncbi:MAG: zinc-dependent metalloprotease, partial [Propionibacteriaceae bacterium]|nr:zinc-dependent metalloprotease [Propionibacteriaceae bacterium]
ATALAETMRRRRATSGPAEATFQALVGLELRPRRLRDAANLWAALREARGAHARDEVWNHPDVVPSAADLDDPLGFVNGDRAAAEPASSSIDDELARLLEQAERERDAERRQDDTGDEPDA